jgi:putative membrane protein
MTGAGPDPAERRHVHPVTPLVHAIRTAPAVVVGIALFSGGTVFDLGLWVIPAFALAVLAVGLVVAGFSFLAWQRLEYWFDADGDFRIDSGVLARRERRLQLSRLQAVDLLQPLAARLVNMASVRIEVAGAGDSRAVVEFLTLPQAEALRAEVLARAAGVRHDAPAAPEEVALEVGTGMLLRSLLLRGSTVLAVLITVAAVIGGFALLGPLGLLTLGLGVFVPVVAVINEFLSFYGFTVARSPDGLRLRSGLLSTRAQTVPPGRVHAVEFTQSWLWRRRDWVRVTVNIAGAGGGSEDQGSGTQHVLLPVADRADAYRLVRQVMPELDVPGVALEAAPDRAARRAWIQHAQLAWGCNDEILVTTRGRFVRRTAVIPHARVQSVRVTQGPWQRALGLATVHADSVPGPVLVEALHRDGAQARQIAQAQVVRTRTAIAASGGARWMTQGAASEVLPPDLPPPDAATPPLALPPPVPDHG